MDHAQAYATLTRLIKTVDDPEVVEVVHVVRDMVTEQAELKQGLTLAVGKLRMINQTDDKS